MKYDSQYQESLFLDIVFLCFCRPIDLLWDTLTTERMVS